jgi:hypothetical protein
MHRPLQLLQTSSLQIVELNAAVASWKVWPNVLLEVVAQSTWKDQILKYCVVVELQSSKYMK